MGCSLLGSSVHEILQARILAWVDLPDPGIEPLQVSHIAGSFFTVWGTREAYELQQILNSE